MAPLLFILHFYMLLHLGRSQSDVECLKEVKESVKESGTFLHSWRFENRTSSAPNICDFIGVQCLHPTEMKVYSLSLSGAGLRGTFPRGLEKCSSLTGLDLSSNSFSGPIPSTICKILPYLVKLDLSDNNISGFIPEGFESCTYLNELKLQQNHLIGPIPGQIGLLSRLKIFNVANNRLSGEIPYTFRQSGEAKFAASEFEGNEGLCGAPLDKKCDSSGNKSTNTALVAGVAVGGIISVLAVSSICIWIIMRKPRKMKYESNWAKKIRAPSTITVAMFDAPLVKVKLSDLMAATNNFAAENVLATGRTGVFYKATLRDGSALAIKRLKRSANSERHFRSEMETLASVRHQNLVPLLGYCIAGLERLLIYKHMPNGSLKRIIHEVDASQKPDWDRRLKMAIGAARGLSWMHHSCNPRLIHRNISASSILLDEDFESRITDFGLARLMNPVDTHISTFVSGDFGEVGYVAPEYVRTLVATPKGDVYSFGVVLLELVTGQKPMDITVDGEFKGNLVEWIGGLFKTGHVYAAIDKLLLNKGHDAELMQFLKVACTCVLSCPKERPSMYEVYQLLQAIAQRQPPSAPQEPVKSTSD